MNKICSKCKVNLPLEAFGKSKNSRNGLKASCKQCRNIASQEAYKKNPTKRQNYHKEFYKANKEVYAERYQKHISDPKNKQALLEYNRQFYYANLDYYKKAGKNWRLKNPDKNTAKSNKYRALKLQAIPKWLTKEDFVKINALYREARILTKKTGILHEVDHIIPLQGKNVSGLHVPSNLQILTKTDNLKKSNKFKEL